MTSNKNHNRRDTGGRPGSAAGGVRPVRVRSKRLDEIQEDRLVLAFYLIARDLVDDRTEPVSDDAPLRSEPDTETKVAS